MILHVQLQIALRSSLCANLCDVLSNEKAVPILIIATLEGESIVFVYSGSSYGVTYDVQIVY